MLAGRAKSLLSNNGKLLSLLRYSSSKSTKDYVDNQQLDGNPLEGFKSREHEFYRARSHDIMPRTAEELAEQDVSDRVLRKEEQQELEKYEQHSTVSLRGVMQSNVPEPFNPMGRNPTHLNMPGGGIKLEQKYVSDILQKVHPSKQFSTSARHQNQAADMNIPSYTDIPCPQGVQGYDCIEFKLWLKNCQRHDLNCDQMIDDFETGRKTLAQIFVEQDELIRSVVAQRTNTSGFIGHEGIQSIPLPARRQGPGLKEEFVQGIQTDFKRHYSTSSGGSHEWN